MVDLQEFIADALSGVVRGVWSARSACHGYPCYIAPTIRRITKSGEEEGSVSTECSVQMIEFDVAVSVTDTSGQETTVSGSAKGESKGLIKVMAADVAMEGEASRVSKIENTNNRVSRLKFSVPIAFYGADLNVMHEIQKGKPSPLGD